MFCFSVKNPQSLENVLDYWWPVAKEHAPEAKYFLVGCKADLSPHRDFLTPLIRSPTMISVIQSIGSLVTPTPSEFDDFFSQFLKAFFTH